MFSNFFTPLAWKLIFANNIIISGGLIQFYIYYKMFPKIIKENFQNCTLPDDPQLAENILLYYQDEKIMFKHKGGSKAAESLMKDYLENTMMKRVILLWHLIGISGSLGIIRGKSHIIKICLAMFLGNCLHCVTPIVRAKDVYDLSKLVREGNQEVWENLNEARFVQRLDEIYSLKVYYSRILGLGLVSAGMMYANPLVGGLIVSYGYVANWPWRFD